MYGYGYGYGAGGWMHGFPLFFHGWGMLLWIVLIGAGVVLAARLLRRTPPLRARSTS